MCARRAIARSRSQPAADAIEGAAISASFLCLLHCLALPLLLLALPAVAGAFLRSEMFHYAAVALVAPAAALAFWLGFRRHCAVHPALFGAAGVACLLLALLPSWEEFAADAITVAGSLLLVGGHMTNWRLRRAIA
ncbi:MAG TPA: MerC domain-containing protein [Sphingopyxis sp.]|nr:MerC domain-containing protein [Sphingopyxis sp.]HMP43753.1 MerC domain-containing protein [Sphingopyxis sp.]HMQ17546.1 MerC domain-containing protein [Sphingopyxis sp.]